MTQRFVMFGVALLVCAGCASFQQADRDARQGAVATHQQLVGLKQAVAVKIDAERRYYQESIGVLTNSQKRIDYLQLRRLSIQRAEREAAGMRKQPSEISVESVAATVKAGVDDWAAFVDASEATRRVHLEKTKDSLQRLNDLSHEYTVLERTLVQLSTPADRQTQLTALVEFIKKTAEYYKKLEDNQKKAAEEK